MIPDYLGYVLTGIAHQEYTNATTGALVNLETGEWDAELIEKLGYPKKLFGKLSMPCETLGTLTEEIRSEVGYDLTVIHPASHDTGSAVLAMPTNSENAIYLSSGTWSLMGIEHKVPDASDASREKNFTHEGRVDHRFRYLTNIMGLWIIQSIKKELGGKYSFNDLCEMATEIGDTEYRINVNDSRFLAPKSMIRAINEAYGTNEWSLRTAEQFCKESEEFYSNLSTLYPNSRIFALTPIWRGYILKIKVPIGAFENVAKQLEKIANSLPNVTLIDCIDFVPHEAKMFSPDILHPNILGFSYYAKGVIKSIKSECEV